jgi:hypothetical protein
MSTKRPGAFNLAAAAAIFALLCAPAEARNVQLMAAGGGQVRAFVVGINAYSSIRPLKGAVADARDLETTLKSAGVADLTVLIDADATRKNFETGMQRLIDVSMTDDLAIISFAGHASQAPELVKGSETDGMDEVFLLSPFELTGPGNAEVIIDDEMNHWLLQLARKRVDVLYIADTAHGGGMLDASLPPDDLADVTFLAAGDKYSKGLEVRLPGAPTLRGALSYAVARSIDGGQDGAVTRQQLFGFARQIAYQYSETKQTIVTEPAGDAAKLDKVVFRLKGSGE